MKTFPEGSSQSGGGGVTVGTTVSNGTPNTLLETDGAGKVNDATGLVWTNANGLRATIAGTERFGTDQFGYVYVSGVGGILSFNGQSIAAGTALAATISRAATAVIKIGDGNVVQGTWSATATSPGSIGSNQNDYNPGSRSAFIRLAASTPVNITGLVFASAGVDGEVHTIVNIGATNAISLTNEDALSAAANRFTTSTGATLVLSAKQAADVVYDLTASRWLVFKRN